jgi:hypothetical protein
MTRSSGKSGDLRPTHGKDARRVVTAWAAVALAGAVLAIALAGATPAVAGPAFPWAATEAPVPSGAASSPFAFPDTFIQEQCISDSTCIAVGSYKDTGGNTWGLIEKLSGGTWSATAAPEPADANSPSYAGLNSVSCTSATACTAVGDYMNDLGHSAALVVTLSGTTWTAAAAPQPSGSDDGNTRLSSVSCTAATACTAVGADATSATSSDGFTDTLSGTTWTPAQVGLPSNAAATNRTGSLVQVSCTSDTTCTAVGSYKDSSGHTAPLIDTLSSSWAAVEASLPGDSGTDGDGQLNASLVSVSCTAATACTAVGSYNDSSTVNSRGGYVWGLIDSLSGTTWSAVSAPEPGGAGTDTLGNQGAQLVSVSCSSATWCAAVGGFQDSTVGPGFAYGLIDTGSGTSWSGDAAPQPAGAGTDLDGEENSGLVSVSCDSDTYCAAAGSYYDASAHHLGYLIDLESGTPTATGAPTPSNTAYSPLNTISCTDENYCGAGGTYGDTGGNIQGLLELGETTQGAPGPATQLVFSTEPAGATVGGAFTTQPVVTVEDASGDVITSDSSTVSLSIASGTPTSGGPGALSGCSPNESLGVITFSGCQIGTTGTAYELDATDGSLTAATSAAFNVTAATPLPHVTSFSPLSGVAGTHVTLVGTGLADATEVDFTGSSAPATIDSDTATKIVVEVPQDATLGPLTVKNVSGPAVTTASFKPLPKITSLDAYDGQTLNTVVITGTNLTGVTGVKFGTTHASFTTSAATQVSATVPAGFSSGKVSVTTPDGTTVSTGTYSITKVTGMTPTSGAAGAIVTITGQGLGSATSVAFSGAPPQALMGPATPTAIKVAVPASSALDGPLTVHTPNIDIGGIATSASFKLLPKITSLAPSPAHASSSVVVAGSNFEPTGLAPTVKLGATVLTPVSPSGTGFTVALPANVVTGTLTVITPDGSTTTKLNVVPTISGGPTPRHGAAGTPVSLTGLTFTGTSSVKFANGVAAPFVLTGTLGSPQTLSFKVPATAASGPITVTNAGGSTATAGDFTVDPHITSFTPGSAAQGATVTVTGTGFGLNGDTRAIHVGTVAATSVTWVSPTSVKFQIPNGAPVSDKIHIAVNGGATADSATNLKVTATIASFTPTHGPAGTPVVITGSGFTGATGVTFHGIAASSFHVDSATQVTATVPSGTTPGAITVTRPTAPTTLTSATNFDNTAAITNLSETSGHAGDDITVTGTDLTGATTVTFGGGATATATSVTATSLHVTVPAAAQTGAITVTTPLGDAVSGDDFTMEPAIDSFSPGDGAPGTSVVITGSGFTGATDVAFGGVSVGDGNFSVDSATQITATVPAGAATGIVTVQTPGGSAESADSFTVD